jgi:hemoglobin
MTNFTPPGMEQNGNGKSDIRSRHDVELLVNAFYDKVKRDDMIAYLFTDVAKVDWEAHLPRMYDFWEQIIFQTNTYSGNPMQAHLVLHHHSPLRAEHFERWLKLFFESVDEQFDGPAASFTKQRAQSIAQTIESKLWQM